METGSIQYSQKGSKTGTCLGKSPKVHLSVSNITHIIINITMSHIYIYIYMNAKGMVTENALYQTNQKIAFHTMPSPN